MRECIYSSSAEQFTDTTYFRRRIKFVDDLLSRKVCVVPYCTPSLDSIAEVSPLKSLECSEFDCCTKYYVIVLLMKSRPMPPVPQGHVSKIFRAAALVHPI